MACSLTAQWLKDNFLFGVDVTRDDGTEYPLGMFELAIEAAKEILETELGVSLTLRTVTAEAHDIVHGDWERNYQFQLRHGPVRTVTSVELRQGDFSAVSIPSNWVYIRSDKARLIDLIRGQGSVTYTAGLMGTYLPSPMVDFMGYQISPRAAAYLRVSYTAGFDDETYPYPAPLKMAIGHMASLLPLDTAGDLIAGAGIASYSKSMDGLSESVSTTSSATNAGYGARIISYQKQLKDEVAMLRAQYRAPTFGVL